MRSTWVSLLLGIAVPPVALWCQQVREFGPQITLTTSDPLAVVGGLYGAVRPERRVRLAANAGLGVQGSDLAWRVEALGHFHLNPTARGVGVYGGAGVAVAGGTATHGYLVVLVGMEAAPGGPEGWALELGVGGGVRIGASYRWRRRSGGR
jgi:hypothetical protein